MNYKAVVTDLDGTAVDSPRLQVVSDRLRAATEMLESKGIRVCGASGRAELYATSVLESMALRSPVILSGGTRIIDPLSRQELWRCGLSSDQVRTIVAAVRDLPVGMVWNDYKLEDYMSGGWSIKDFDAYDSSYLLELCFVTDAQAAQVVDRLGGVEGLAVVVMVSQRAGLKDIHITNAVATKEHAIYELERIIGVAKEDMIGVGDGHNDLPIFKAVGHKVAMGNAVPELKAEADEVIGSISEDGLAIYFEQLAKETQA